MRQRVAHKPTAVTEGKRGGALLLAHKRRARTDAPGAVECHLDGRHGGAGGRAAAVCAAMFLQPYRLGWTCGAEGLAFSRR